VAYESLSPSERKKAHRERCYKWVSLLHLRGNPPCYVYAGVALLEGSAHECPVLYKMVDEFVKGVGRGVIKELIIYHQNAYTQMPLLSFSRELLEFKADAHAKALKKIIQLEPSMLQPFENLRPP